MERSAQRNPLPQRPGHRSHWHQGVAALRLLGSLGLGLIPAVEVRAQDVTLTTGLEKTNLVVGAVTTLRIYAEINSGIPADFRQIGRWRIDFSSADPRVAGGRFDEILKPEPDGLEGSSAGIEAGTDLLGIADSLRSHAGAGRTGPVELVRIPITAYATGTSRIVVKASPVRGGFTLLKADGAEVPLAWEGIETSATIDVHAEQAVVVPSSVRTVPVNQLEGQEFHIRFEPAATGNLFVDYSTQPNGPWNPLPGGPHNTGTVVDRDPGDARFYRLRNASTGTVPGPVTINYIPIWKQGVSEVEIAFEALNGWQHWIEFTDAPGSEWSLWPGSPFRSGPIRLPGPPTGQAYRVTAHPPVDRSTFDAFLIAGQSNGLLMDYDHQVVVSNAWRFDGHGGFVPLTKPAQDPTLPFIYSFPIPAAEIIAGTQHRPTLIIPCAIGSTTIGQWMPQAGRFDTGTCFGNASQRRLLAAPDGLKALWYAGHEGDMLDDVLLARYAEHWASLIRAFRNEFGPVPVIYAQAAKLTDASLESRLHAGAEMQRKAESGQPDGLPRHHMVVTFDLPLHDTIHLSPAAHSTLGRRFALATREHVYGEAINGTGPRVLGITFDAGDHSRIRVRFNRPINTSTESYDNQFRVFADGREMRLSRVERDTDPTTVALQLEESPGGVVSVSYGDRPAAGPNLTLLHVVRDDDGLPAPQFGPVIVR